MHVEAIIPTAFKTATATFFDHAAFKFIGAGLA